MWTEGCSVTILEADCSFPSKIDSSTTGPTHYDGQCKFTRFSTKAKDENDKRTFKSPSGTGTEEVFGVAEKNFSNDAGDNKTYEVAFVIGSDTQNANKLTIKLETAS